MQPDSNWFLSQILCHNFTCVPCKQVIILDLSIYSWIGVYISPLVVLKVLSSTMNTNGQVRSVGVKALDRQLLSFPVLNE